MGEILSRVSNDVTEVLVVAERMFAEVEAQVEAQIGQEAWARASRAGSDTSTWLCRIVL